MQNYQFSKVKNSLLELKKIMESTDRELKDRKEKKQKERQKNYFLSGLLCLKMMLISLKDQK